MDDPRIVRTQAPASTEAELLALAAQLPPPRLERYATRLVPVADGVRLAVTEGGEGRPVLMLHGWLATSEGNWLSCGFADALVDAGCRVLMVDFRGHGQSERPDPASGLPEDILAFDGLALIEALELSDFDLVGYSLGARTALRMAVRGARPRRLVLAGLGFDTLTDPPGELDLFEAAMTGPPPADDDMSVPALLRRMADQTGADKRAGVALLRSTTPTSAADMAALDIPTLIVLGHADIAVGAPEPIHQAIPGSILKRVAGDHISALLEAEMKTEIVNFLAD